MASSLTLVAQAPADARSPRLPHAAHGAQALTLLGDDVPAAAELNGMSPGELRRVLRQDPTAWLDRDTRMYYVEPADRGPRSLAPDAPPFPLDQTFLLRGTERAAGALTEIAGLLLCGSGAHPGGGVTGLPGWHAAELAGSELGR